MAGLSISPQAGGLPQRAEPLGCGGAELGSKKLRLRKWRERGDKTNRPGTVPYTSSGFRPNLYVLVLVVLVLVLVLVLVVQVVLCVFHLLRFVW